MGKKQEKRQAREAAVAQFVANAIDMAAVPVRIGKKPHRVEDAPAHTTKSYWRVGDTHTTFGVNVFYTDNKDEKGRRFRVAVTEETEDDYDEW